MRSRILALGLALGSALLASCDRPDETVLYTVTATRTGSGGGTVTSTPAGIACGEDCSEVHANGATVTLHASPDAGSAFVGWSGAGCVGTDDCVFTVVADTTVEARFEVVRMLTATRSGNGSGTVTSTPAGIVCGADCSQAYPQGTAVTLHASPAAGSGFGGWTSGGCAGTTDCVVDLVADTTVNALFVIPLACTLVTNAQACTNGSIAELNLGPLTAATCRTQCQSRMPAAGIASGCWIVASNTNCYCRSGNLVTGSTFSGGTCN